MIQLCVLAPALNGSTPKVPHTVHCTVDKIFTQSTLKLLRACVWFLKEAVISILGIAVRVIGMLSEVQCVFKVELTAIISETQHSLNTAT